MDHTKGANQKLLTGPDPKAPRLETPKTKPQTDFYVAPDGTAYKASDADLALTHTERYINISSPDRTNHILYGDKTGGGHLYPGKNAFPSSWGPDQVMHNVSDVITDPKLNWEPGRVMKGNQRYEVTGIRDGVECLL